ncbi:MAG: hypothetical protein KGJ80_07395 [Chloroflexota bacterium]|nr:hypothetical protein [Chloroflexota bacterium]
MKRTIMLLTALACWLLAACAPAPTAVPSVASAPTTIPSATSTPTVAPTATSTPIPDINQFIAQVTNSPHDTVKAADGSAELLIPNGALPPGKNANDIKITRIDPANASVTLQGKPPLFGYHFEPDGLRFSTPVLLRIITEASQDGATPGLVMVSQNNVSLLSPTAAAIDQGNHKLTVTAPVLHFSDVMGLTIFSLEVSAPTQVDVGASFSADGQLVPHPSVVSDASATVESWDWFATGAATVTAPKVGRAPATGGPFRGSRTDQMRFICSADPGSATVGAYVDFGFSVVIRVSSIAAGAPVEVLVTSRMTISNAKSLKCVRPIPPTPTPTKPPPTLTQKQLFGLYLLLMGIPTDPAGHAPFVGMPGEEEVDVEQGSIIITGRPPWVNVAGPLNPDGTFTAVGVGDVAGRHVIGVQFVGRLSPSGLSGDYSMGVKVVVTQDGKQVTGGLLPTGQSIVFHVQGKHK